MAIGPKAKWIKNKFSNLKNLLLIFCGAISINFFIIYFFKSYSLISNLIIVSSLFLIISTFLDLFKKPKFNLSRIISHLSFGLLIFFIGINHNFSVEKDFNIKLGETKKIDNYKFFLQDLKLEQNTNYKAVIGKIQKVIIKRKKNLKSRGQIYDKPQTLTYEASIKSIFSGTII